MFSYLKSNAVLNVDIQNVQTLSSNDILRNNLIEKDLQSVLKPLNLMQSILFCEKYSFRDNIITSKTYFYNFLRILFVLTYLCAILYAWVLFITQYCEQIWGDYSLYYSSNVVIDFIVLLIGDLINLVLNIMHSYYNKLMVLKIQHVLRALQINGSELRSFIICNWSWVIILNVAYIGFITFFYLVFGLDIFDMTSIYVCIAFDINIVYAISLLKVIVKQLRVWNEKVLNSQNTEDSERKEYWKIMLDVYLNIMETYMIIEMTSRHMIIFYIISTTYFSLKNLAMVLILLRSLIARGEIKYISLLVATEISNIKNIMMIVCLSVQCERFYAAMRDVQSSCIILVKSRHFSERRVYKTIQRVQKASFKKMSACGLFIIDAALPLQLSSFITSYTIVLLQFVFL